MDGATGTPLPAAGFLKIPAGGEPYLEGHRCAACGEIFLAPRPACPKCCSRKPMTAVRLSNRGHLYSYCVVYRSFPGIDVPYVSAIVDLEGGGTVKGNLIDVEPDPAKIAFGMAVEVVYRDALGRRDKDGNAYLSYFFRPRA
jgi:uncharacterized OB-fold protein